MTPEPSERAERAKAHAANAMCAALDGEVDGGIIDLAYAAEALAEAITDLERFTAKLSQFTVVELADAVHKILTKVYPDE